MGPDHLLLREAICRTTHDRVQPVQHMGSPVVRQDQEIQRPWHLLLPQVQGRATVRSQKRHLEAEGRESPGLLFSPPFSLMPTAKTAFDLTWTAKCAVTVGFPLTITILYLSFTFIFWLIPGTEQRVTVTVECHLLLIHFILIDFNVWLPAMFTIPPHPLFNDVCMEGAFRPNLFLDLKKINSFFYLIFWWIFCFHFSIESTS